MWAIGKVHHDPNANENVGRGDDDQDVYQDDRENDFEHVHHAKKFATILAMMMLMMR